MNRRILLLAALAAAYVAAGAKPAVTWDVPGNQFAADWNRWAGLVKKRMDTPAEQQRFLSPELEKAAWKDAVRDFELLKKTVHYQ